MNKNNPYGYKVGYRENGSRLFVKYFMTYTYNQALFSQRFYRKYPQRTRETNRPIVDPFWEIKPITKKEYLAGIWDEPPFQYIFYDYTPYKFPFRRGYRSIVKTRKSNPAEKFLTPFIFLLFIKFFLGLFDFRATPPFLFLRIFSLCYCAPAGKEN